MKIKFLPWLIWFLAAFFVLYQFILQSANSVMVIDLLTDLHINLSQLGFLSSSFFYFYVILQIPAGLMVDRFGAKRMLLAGLLLCVMATASFSLIHSLAAGISCRLLMGVGSSVAVVGVMYLTHYWFPKALFPLLATMAESIGILGGAIGETSLSQLVGHFGWRNAILFAAGIGVILWIFMFFIVQNRPDYNKPTAGGQCSLKVLLIRFFMAMKSKDLWLAGLFCGFMFSFVVSFGGMWSIPFLQKVYAYSLTQAAFLSGFIFIGAALGAWVFGYTAGYLKKTRLLMGCSGVLAALAASAIFFIPLSFNLLLAMLFLGGLGSGGYVLSFVYIKQNSCETICASAMGFTNMMCLALVLILQPLIGCLLAHYAGHGLSPLVLYQKSLCSLIVLQLIGVIAVLLMRKE